MARKIMAKILLPGGIEKLYYNGQISSFKITDEGGDEKLIIDK